MYDETSIKSLDPIEHIRKRPGMYIPDVEVQGIHHLIEEVLNNSVDEFLVGHCTKIEVEIKNGYITISDNGRGIPTAYNKKLGMSTLTAVFLKTLTGGKFNNDSYKLSSGCNGVGLTVVNALSETLMVWISKDRTIYENQFTKGQLKNHNIKKNYPPQEFTTKIKFYPDQTIFQDASIDIDLLDLRLLYLSSVLPGLDLTFKTGLSSCTRKSAEPLESIHEFKESDLFTFSFIVPEKLTVRLSYSPVFENKILSFVNTIHTYENGSHVDGVLSCIIKILKKLTGKLFSKSQILQGLNLTISVFFQEPVWRGQHKGKVSDSRLSRAVYDILYDPLFIKFKENKGFLKYFIDLITKQEEILQESEIKKAINTVKSSVRENKLPQKLIRSDKCSQEKRELFIVEGSSAAGTVVMARNAQFQEVLPLKGKIRNAFKSSYTDLLQNKEVLDIFLAIGSMEKSNTTLRTQNVFILSDSDPDGNHIVSLILSVFAVGFPSFIKNHNLYITYPPLFSLISGDIRMYGHDFKLLTQEFKQKYKNKEFQIYRNKGLGEMEARELVPVIDPKTRKIKKVIWTKDSKEKLTQLMGKFGEVRKSILEDLENEI